MSTAIRFEEDMEQGSDYGHEAILRRIGALVKQRREELGLSRMSFVKEHGLGSDKTVRELEYGNTLPKLQSLRRIEDGLGWRVGSIMQALQNADQKASRLRMEDFDAFDSAPAGSLDTVPTSELLTEVIKRLTTLQTGMGIQTQEMFGLAAMGYKPEHLDKDEDDTEPDASR